MRRPALLLVLVLAAGCGDGAAGDGTSGIEGRVTIGPQCPVEQAGSPCPDAPYAAIVTVTADGETVQEGRSDADGAFRMTLAPGRYTVVARPIGGDGIAIGTPADVRVEAGSYTRIDLSVDSGIR